MRRVKGAGKIPPHPVAGPNRIGRRPVNLHSKYKKKGRFVKLLFIFDSTIQIENKSRLVNGLKIRWIDGGFGLSGGFVYGRFDG